MQDPCHRDANLAIYNYVLNVVEYQLLYLSYPDNNAFK